MKRFWWADLLRKVHNDEEGAITLETVLIIGAIALPILIFLLKVGWPKIKGYFNTGMEDIDQNVGTAEQ